jgi:DNA-binding Lrp family transcriptional regulator
LDSLDIKVMRELFQGRPTAPSRPEATLSYAKVAKRLGVSEESVRGRAKKLIDSGFIRGWMPHTNPNFLRVKTRIAIVDAKDSANERAVRQLQLLDNTVLVIDYHGSAIGTVFFYSDEKALDTRLALIRSIAEGPIYATWDIVYPPCDLTLTITDWNIVSAMQRAPDAPVSKIARTAGVSTRTVRRRVARMTGALALFQLASADETKLKGTFRTDLIVRWKKGADLRAAQAKLMSILDDYYFFLGFDKEWGFFNMLAPSTSVADGLLRRAAEVEGVEEARLEFAVARYENYGAFSDLVSRKIKELSA